MTFWIFLKEDFVFGAIFLFVIVRPKMLKLLVLCQGKPKIRYKAVKMPFAIEHCYLANRFILKIPMHQKQFFLTF